MKRWLPILAVLALATTPVLAQTRGQVSSGRTLAQKNCALCHAIGRTGQSKREGAPAFRTLGRNYDLDNLQEALAEGIAVGHKGVDMPEFQFAPAQIDALIAYIRTLRR